MTTATAAPTVRSPYRCRSSMRWGCSRTWAIATGSSPIGRSGDTSSPASRRATGDTLRVLLYTHHAQDTQSRSDASFDVTLDLAGLGWDGPARVHEYRFDRDHNSYFRQGRALRTPPPTSFQEALNPHAYSRAEVEQIQALAECRATASASHPRAPDGRLRLTARVAGNGLNFLVIEPESPAEDPTSPFFSLDTSDRLSYPLLRHSVLKRGGEMARTSQDVTEAELAVLRRLWERGPATIRQLVEDVYGQDGTSPYATVQKLLDRLEAKGFVARDRSGAVHVFRAAVERDELIGRRLRAVADTLCGGSLTPLLTHLVQGRRLSDQQRQALRALVEQLDRERKA